MLNKKEPNMNQQERNELLNKIENISEGVYQVIKMLDKNLQESLNHGTDVEVVILTDIQQTLIVQQGFNRKEANIAIQYLTGRLTDQDFKQVA
jgi:serine phosphatase RsbU (regulator of sigma subunit)